MSKVNTPNALADRVLVGTPLLAEEKTASGLYIPDTGQREKHKKGTVVAIGKCVKKTSPYLTVRSWVIPFCHGKYAGPSFLWRVLII